MCTMKTMFCTNFMSKSNDDPPSFENHNIFILFELNREVELPIIRIQDIVGDLTKVDIWNIVLGFIGLVNRSYRLWVTEDIS